MTRGPRQSLARAPSLRSDAHSALIGAASAPQIDRHGKAVTATGMLESAVALLPSCPSSP